MLRSCCFIVAATILVNQTAEAQQSTLTLVCQGTRSSAGEEKADPISTGVVVDFNTRTVQGLGVGHPVKIVNADDLLIDFYGDDGEKLIAGTIYRLTGKLEAWNHVILGASIRTTTYMLKCIPAQRKF